MAWEHIAGETHLGLITLFDVSKKAVDHARLLPTDQELNSVWMNSPLFGRPSEGARGGLVPLISKAKTATSEAIGMDISIIMQRANVRSL